jgi:GNAT superfamily N-acetyltransferase
LYSISSDGVADYIWTKLTQPGEDILDVGQWRYEQEDSVFSFKNCTVATHGSEIMGMLVAFPVESEETVGTSEQDPVLAPYSRLEENHSYYICGMAVVPQYRGLGLGTQFLALAEEQARKRGTTN